MKVMLIRLISNKEPVMILGGWRRNWKDTSLFWAVDEVTDPNGCEYFEYNIKANDFSIIWSGSLEKYDDDCDGFNIQSGIKFGDYLQEKLDTAFQVDDSLWIKLNLDSE